MNQAKAVRLFAALPTVFALDQRRHHGLDMPPADDLGFAASFLCITFREPPEYATVAAFETSLIWP